MLLKIDDICREYLCKGHCVENICIFCVDVTGGEYLYDRPVTDERWKKDEILEAKIKKFLSVSY
jgi:hypothetical protein